MLSPSELGEPQETAEAREAEQDITRWVTLTEVIGGVEAGAEIARWVPAEVEPTGEAVTCAQTSATSTSAPTGTGAIRHLGSAIGQMTHAGCRKMVPAGGARSTVMATERVEGAIAGTHMAATRTGVRKQWIVVAGRRKMARACVSPLMAAQVGLVQASKIRRIVQEAMAYASGIWPKTMADAYRHSSR